MKRPNALHGPAIDAYIVPDTDEHQVNVFFWKMKTDLCIPIIIGVLINYIVSNYYVI